MVVAQTGVVEMTAMDGILSQKIDAARLRHRLVAAGTGLVGAVICFVAVLMLAALADWWIDLPRWLRVILLAANTVLAAACLVRHGLQPLLRGVDEETIALAVERMERGFATRLISAVQFSRPGGVSPGESPAIVAVIIRQAEQLAASVDFRHAISTDRLRRWAAAATAMLGLMALLGFCGGGSSGPLLRRALGMNVPWPSRTQVEVLSGSFTVAGGESATLRARAIGWQPNVGQAELSYVSGQHQRIALERTAEGQYVANVDNVREPFNYRIRLYDGVSETCTVRVEPRPLVKSMTCTQIFPAYTKQPDTPRSPKDLLLLAGGRLRVTITASKPLQVRSGSEQPYNRLEFTMRTGAAPVEPVALTPDPSGDGRWSAEWPVTDRVLGFSVKLVDTLGVESRNEPFYPLAVLPDRAPSIRITSPDRREVLVTADATCRVGFVAEDDCGLAGVWLHYRVGEQPEQVIALAVEENTRRVQGYYPWLMSKLTPPPGQPSLEGSLIEFYMEAKDANDLHGPGVATSDHYQLRVVSKAEKQADLMARMSESFAVLQELGDRQEKAAKDLGTLILEQPDSRRPNR